MAIKCAASSRLALPAVLRNVFRSQFTSVSLINPYHRQPACGPLFSSNIRFQRSFSSMLRLRDSQSDQLAPAAPEISAVADDTVPSRPKTPKKKDYDSFGKKGGWKDHKTHPKDQRRSPENSKGRTDRERRTFRNETRREADKQPRQRWQERAEKSKQFSEKGGKKKPEAWQVQKSALKEKFSGGWNPPKKLSPDALDGIRHLHAKAPEQFTTAVLAEEFEMSPEAIRRILKSKWRPSEDEMESRRKRWENRHDRIWSRMAELGLRPSTNRTRPLSDFHVLYDDNNRERR
ncbi:hypothetical protein PENCOP_c016G07345 [Penicillium coprophilum]|uniref:Required for respiratory growth protein 9, mitochondrial n=1 Tax=Penicillium coprophilum TaxID=36646 RepID=A0A1V6U825_9EURO|nr:hypothetical protein PENCOP_c016G07345 [Penicillium coprophilum]